MLKAHKTRIINHNQETGMGDGCHQKVEPTDDLGPQSNVEIICLKIFTEWM